MKKKISFTIILIACGMLFTSCFESMQSITKTNGQYVINSKISISKDSLSTLLYFGEAVSDGLDSMEDYEDYDDYSDSLGDLMDNSVKKSNSSSIPQLSQEDIDDLYDSFKKSNPFPVGGTIFKVDTETEAGIGYEAKVSEYNYSSTNYAAFIPKKYKNAMTIEISKSIVEMAKEYGEISSLLYGIKHRIYISKSLLKTISTAEVTDSNYVGKELFYYDVGDMWCIELPYSHLASTEGKNLKYIVMYY